MLKFISDNQDRQSFYEEIGKDKWISETTMDSVINLPRDHSMSKSPREIDNIVRSPVVESDKALLKKWDLLGGSMVESIGAHDGELYDEQDNGMGKQDMEKEAFSVLGRI